MQNLTEAENMALGASAAAVEAVILQPTIYWKNAAQQGLPFTMKPDVVYRGLGAALCNEMGQMAVQFGTTSWVQKMVVGDAEKEMTTGEEVSCALLGGLLAAPVAQLPEVTMIQQQRFGGTLVGTPIRIVKEYGLMQGLFRGMTAVAIRDSIYVGCLLGVTPVLQNHLHKKYDVNLTAAGFTASCFGGLIAGVVTCPADAISTVMKGDLEQAQYKGFFNTFQQRAAGGINVLFGGAMWRAVNIIGTIGIANECRVRFAPLMFPAKF
jgi:solute carrier family 25 carnitine/acylcarnitine transporter 20/29